MEHIKFENLPFRPNARQIIYYEDVYDPAVNRFIQQNYVGLYKAFQGMGLNFYYLPMLSQEYAIEEKILYFAPYLSKKLVRGYRFQTSALLQFVKEGGKDLGPSLLYNGLPNFSKAESIFDIFPLSGLELSVDAIIEAFGTVDIIRAYPCPPRYSLSIDDDLFEYPEDEDERKSKEETERLLKELRENVTRLRLEGVSLMAIHEFIDSQERLSRMVITPDYRIFLPDYNNMKIEMGALPKAIYFLFLRYPDGLICKHMPDYYNELLCIYRQLRPFTDEARLRLTITKVVNPLSNAMNENIARVRKAFVDKFDEHLANKYYITGVRGQQYNVQLDRNLITWEE